MKAAGRHRCWWVWVRPGTPSSPRASCCSRPLALNAGRLQVEGGADLDVMAVTSRLSTIQPLGSYRLQLQGGDSTSLQLTTLDGALQLKGQGQWVGQRLRFQGEAWAAEGREAALANLLTMIGQRSGSRVLLSVG